MWRHDHASSVPTTGRPLADTPDVALVRLARGGDGRAFDEIVMRYDAKVRQLASRLVGAADVDDVSQMAFLSVYRALDGFEESASFSSWLYRIAWNAGLMRLRSQRRRREVSLEDLSAHGQAGEPEAVEAPGSDPEVDLERIETSDAVSEAVDSLPQRYRNVVVMRHLREMSTQDVGRALGLTTATVKTRLHRARRGLRTSLAAVA